MTVTGRGRTIAYLVRSDSGLRRLPRDASVSRGTVHQYFGFYRWRVTYTSRHCFRIGSAYARLIPPTPAGAA